METKFIDREIMDKAVCPFCKAVIDPPQEPSRNTLYEMPIGQCCCGATYAYDITGHNLGSAMIEALVHCCDDNWDLAWEMLPDEDYIEGHLDNYDLQTHRIIHGGVYEGRRIAGVLYFIKLQKDIKGLTEADNSVKTNVIAHSQKSRLEPRKNRSFLKKEVESLVTNYEVKTLLDMAATDNHIIRTLQRLLYSPDRLIRFRTADILGKVSAEISQHDPGLITKFLQGLFTALTDSAASSWGYLDAIGEIISNLPEKFASFIPRIYLLARDRALLPDILRSLSKIGETNPDLIRENSLYFIPLFHDPDPEIRGNALILIGHLAASEFVEDIIKFSKDSASIDIYKEGDLIRRSLSDIATEILDKYSPKIQ